MGSPIMKSSQTSSPRLFVLGGKKAFGRPLSHITVGRGGGEMTGREKGGRRGKKESEQRQAKIEL